MLRLSSLRDVGRFINPATNIAVNVKTGKKKGYKTDILFYLYNGKEVLISDFEFWGKWKEDYKK